MKTFFVQINATSAKSCKGWPAGWRMQRSLPRIYSTAGQFDLLAKFYVDDDEDVGHFVNQRVRSFRASGHFYDGDFPRLLEQLR